MNDVGEGKEVSNLALNAAAYIDGRFGIVESVDDRISYTIKKVRKKSL